MSNPKCPECLRPLYRRNGTLYCKHCAFDAAEYKTAAEWLETRYLDGQAFWSDGNQQLDTARDALNIVRVDRVMFPDDLTGKDVAVRHATDNGDVDWSYLTQAEFDALQSEIESQPDHCPYCGNELERDASDNTDNGWYCAACERYLETDETTEAIV